MQATPFDTQVRTQIETIPTCAHIKDAPSFHLEQDGTDYYIYRYSLTGVCEDHGPFDKGTALDYWNQVIETIERRK